MENDYHTRFIAHARVQISNGIVVVHRESIVVKNEDDRKVERVQRHFDETEFRVSYPRAARLLAPLLNRRAGNKDR